jgi:hypothetical protein
LLYLGEMLHLLLLEYIKHQEVKMLGIMLLLCRLILLHQLLL